MTTTTHYDIIIIGTGAGGGTLAYHLAPTDKKILILERGAFLPRENANWDTVEVVQKTATIPRKFGTTRKDTNCIPAWVTTSVAIPKSMVVSSSAGAILQGENRVVHKGGISPSWQLKYQDFEPYYTQAEQLF
jgi:choline dehydrogenase-like flavoprotein